MIHAYKLIGTNLPNRILCRMNKSIHPLFALRHGVAQLLLWSAFYYLLPALLPLLRAEGVPTEAVSAAISGALLLWALTLPVAGSLVDKGHGVLLMRGGGLLGCLLMVLALVLPRQVALVPIVLLGFTMASTLYDPCFALLLRTRGLDASGAITKVTLIAGLATVMTYPLVSALRHVMPWPAIVLVFAVVALVGVALLPSQPSAPSGKVREVDTRALAVASLPVILLVATPFGLGIFSHASMLFVLPLALTEQGWDAAMVLLLPAMLGPAQVVGRLVWLKFAPDGLGRRLGADAVFLVAGDPGGVGGQWRQLDDDYSGNGAAGGAARHQHRVAAAGGAQRVAGGNDRPIPRFRGYDRHLLHGDCTGGCRFCSRQFRLLRAGGAGGMLELGGPAGDLRPSRPVAQEVGMERIIVAGGAMTPFNRRKDQSSWRDWAAEVFLAALDDAGLGPDDIDALVFSSESDFFTLQLNPASVLAPDLGLGGISVMRVEGGGASGHVAVQAAAMQVLSGQAARVAVIGAEPSASQLPASDVVALYGLSFDALTEGMTGVDATSLYALSAAGFMQRTGANAADFAGVAVRNRQHARHNPNAHLPLDTDIEAVLASPGHRRALSPAGLLAAVGWRGMRDSGPARRCA